MGLRKVWLAMLLVDTTDRQLDEDALSFFQAVVLKSVEYYDHIFDTYIGAPGPRGQPWPVFDLKSISSLRERRRKLPAPKARTSTQVAWERAHELSVSHQLLCAAVLFLRNPDSSSLQETLEMTECVTMALGQLLRCNRDVADAKSRKMLQLLLERAVRRIQESYADGAPLQKGDYREALSAAALEELRELATRAEKAVRRCGSDRKVDRAFEDRMQDLFERLGMVVVRARPGLASGDLICLANDANTTFSVLVELKTARQPYAFPKSDQRALREYVDQIRSRLSLMPPLRLALLVSREPAATVVSKLQALQAQLGVPLRYATAWDLAGFQRQVRGQPPLNAFLTAVLNGDTLVDPSVLDDVIRSRRNEAHKWTQLVEGLLTGA